MFAIPENSWAVCCPREDSSEDVISAYSELKLSTRLSIDLPRPLTIEKPETMNIVQKAIAQLVALALPVNLKRGRFFIWNSCKRGCD
jgi:hypothetical protein